MYLNCRSLNVWKRIFTAVSKDILAILANRMCNGAVNNSNIDSISLLWHTCHPPCRRVFYEKTRILLIYETPMQFYFWSEIKRIDAIFYISAGNTCTFINLSGTMKLLKKFPKATRSHGKRVEGGARARGGGGAAEALAGGAQLSAWQGGAGRRRAANGHGAGRSRGASGEARPRGHATGTTRDARTLDSAARRTLARAAAALRRSPPPALHRPPSPLVQRPLFISDHPVQTTTTLWAPTPM